jgi:hypothetical protein
MDEKSLNLVVMLSPSLAALIRCAQFDDRDVGYSENGAFATRSAKFGGANPST